MSTSDINESRKRIGKIAKVYLLLSVAAVIIDWVYGLFSHGVDSAAMTLMFLYPLLGGALFYFSMGKLIPGLADCPGFRLFSNIYNSGIGTLTAASFLKGVFEIAGTDSPHLKYYYLAGGLFVAAGLIILIAVKQNRLFNLRKY